jgi:large subunit ribosomal protein L21
MYAIVETGGKQYRVSEGDRVDVDRLGFKKGEVVALDQVLLLSDESGVSVGEDVKDVRVIAEVLGESKGRKIFSFKYKRRKGYRRKIGHRQIFTNLLIKRIER